MHVSEHNGFTQALKDWRKLRKMSQLDLSLEAEVSQRHLSWLETGKSRPSREMIIRLADTLDIPNRDRNRLLDLAGFAPFYSESVLGEPVMQLVSDVLEKMLNNHNPYPAIVVDRFWNLKMKNRAADKLFGLLGNIPEVLDRIGDDGQFNIARFSLHPQGLRQYISNWQEVVTPFYTRLKREATTRHDPEVIKLIDSLEQFVVNDLVNTSHSTQLTPILPLKYNVGGVKLSLISVISTFGSAQDVTANELRIETFYPADDVTTAFFNDNSTS